MLKYIDREMLQQTLGEMTGQQKKENKEIEDIFLENVNHEIRTPLNAIIGFNDLLNGVSGQHMDEDEKLMLKDHIRKNADRLLTVVSDMIDLSKMEKGCLKLHKTVVSLMEACYHARESVKYEVQEGVRLLHEYPTALKDLYIYADGKRLEQLLHHFLLNACQHTYAGTITLKVKKLPNKVTGRPMLQMRVDDTGVGIPHDMEEQLFLPFRKADRKTEGLGVGLAICKQIARLFGGRVYLDRDYVGGTSFVFETPYDEV